MRTSVNSFLRRSIPASLLPMRTVFRGMMLFAAMLLSFQPMLADKSQLIFTAACGGSGTADDGAVWTVTSDGEESDFAADGIHYGTGTKKVTYLQLSTSNIAGAVTKVVVNTRDTQKKATVSVSVGGTAYTCSGSATATNTSSDYEFKGSASGEIIVRIDRGSSMLKAIYVKSIIVTYGNENEKRELQSIAVSGMTTEYEMGETFSFDGVCTATYKVTDGEKVTEETVSVQPTSVSTPDMTAAGEQQVKVTYTEGEGEEAVTVETSYNIVITPVHPKLIIDGTPLTSTATDKEKTLTYTTTSGQDIDIVMSAGAKQFASTGDHRYTDNVVLIGKADTYIYNATSLPGRITRFEIYANKGASAKVSVSVVFGDTPQPQAAEDGANVFSQTLSELDHVYNCTSAVPDDARYFMYRVTNDNNSQVAFRILYEDNPNAPLITPEKRSVHADAAGGEGTVQMTYQNIDLPTVQTALFSDEACTEEFEGDWLTVTTDDKKQLHYTISENTDYEPRTAYLRLRASASDDSDLLLEKVLRFTQDGAEHVYTFSSLDELIVAEVPDGSEVTVDFTDVTITDIFTTQSSKKRQGIYLNAVKDGRNIEIYYNGATVPDEWEIGGKVSVKALRAVWTFYNNSFWELIPAEGFSWTSLTYTPGTPVATIAVQSIRIGVNEEVSLQAEVTPTEAEHALTYSIKEGSDDCIVLNGSEIRGTAAGTATLIATVPDGNGYTGTSVEFTVTVIPENTDILTTAIIGTESQYASWNNKTGFGTKAVFAGNTMTATGANAGAIQMRAKENSGIVMTGGNGLYLRGLAVTVASGNNVLEVYGKKTAYQSTEDLYDTEKRGTLLGTVSATGAMTLEEGVSLEDNYPYIGLRSKANTLYLKSITITWGEVFAYEDFRAELTEDQTYTLCTKREILLVRGGTLWEIDYRDESKGQLCLVQAEAPYVAGRAYIFIATAEKLEVVYGETAADEPQAFNGLHGTWNSLGADEMAGGYIFGTDNQLHPVGSGDDTSLPAFSAYIVREEIPETSTADASRPRMYVTLPALTPTDLETVDAAGQNARKILKGGHLYILRNGHLYEAGGRMTR